MNDFSSRLYFLRKGMSFKAFSAKTGVPAATLERLEKVSSDIKSDQAIKICTSCGVSVDWLLTGREGITTHLDYGRREEMFEAKGATGLGVAGIADLMQRPLDEVQAAFAGGPVDGGFADTFDDRVRPWIEYRKPPALREERYRAMRHPDDLRRGADTATGKVVQGAPLSEAPPGSCPGCLARDAEIAYLRGVVCDQASALKSLAGRETGK